MMRAKLVHAQRVLLSTCGFFRQAFLSRNVNAWNFSCIESITGDSWRAPGHDCCPRSPNRRIEERRPERGAKEMCHANQRHHDWCAPHRSPGTNLAVAAALMLDGDCGILPVVDGGKLVGIVTDRDMYIALRARDRRASEMTGPRGRADAGVHLQSG